MGLFLAIMVGLVFWIIAWSLGAKSIDAFLVTAVIFLIAAAAHVAKPRLPGGRDAAEGS